MQLPEKGTPVDRLVRGYPSAGRVLLRCMVCWNRGSERNFRTPSGYLSHLENYHNANPSDVIVRQESSDERNDGE